MKILFTITYYTPYVSGLTIHAMRLAKELEKRGYSVEILTSQHDKKLPIVETDKSISIKRVPYMLRLSKGFFMPTYIFHAYKEIKKADVVVSHLPQFESFLVALIAKMLKKRFYCIYHCDIILPHSNFNYVIEKLIYIANCISLTLSGKIVTYTEDFAKHSKLLLRFQKKIIFIYPPIPIPKINYNIKKKIQNMLPKKKYYIGVAGRIAAEKGIEYLLETIPLLKKEFGNNFVILFAGPKHPVGEEKYWRKISPLLKKYNEYIVFLRTFKFEEIGAFYSFLDVLVLPSINATEAFGMVQVEAMLCGTPVVASSLPGVRVPIQETKMGLLVPKEDSKKLAQAIVEVLKNRKKYIKDKKNVENVFSFDKTISEYEKIFQAAYNVK